MGSTPPSPSALRPRLDLENSVTTAAAPSSHHRLALVRPLPPHLATGHCRTGHPFIRGPIASHPLGLNRLVPHRTSTEDEENGSSSDEVGQSFSGSEPSSSSFGSERSSSSSSSGSEGRGGC